MSPNTPATSLIMVTAANGHRGLTVLVSILCMIISVFTVPPMLGLLVPTMQHVNISVGKLLLNIVIRILVPLLAGMCLRRISPVKKFVTKWNNTVKYVGISFLVCIFLVKISETSASGNLEKVSVVKLLLVIALGTSFTMFNLLSNYGLLSVLPCLSKKSTVTLSIMSCLRVVSFPATIIDVLPDIKDEDSEDMERGNEFKDSYVESKFNEGAVFTICTDTISVKDENKD
ncbi:uncharacterized protein LOC114530736 [Dendronephthya gigantea]|uniref:uncharacterized protein LOC114530736 n=1 Tax=Dendronephthya gigantea TaxID=151771 RepID=UPI00106C27CF|nr:uncharacterized protein LOC114530736 [Dendronephthya gigantea]